MIQRELKRKFLVLKYAKRREIIKKQLKTAASFDERLSIDEKLQKLPRNSSKIRLRNRCWKTGRPRGYFRYFGLCRNMVRQYAHDCLLPGVKKASW